MRIPLLPVLSRSASQSSGLEYDFSRAIWLPEPPEPVTLYLSSGGKLPARVVERRRNTLQVVIVVPAKQLDSSRLDGLVLEYANACGRVRLTGKVTVENVRNSTLLRIEEADMIEAAEERAYARVKAACPVIIYVERKRWETHTVNVSGGGLLLPSTYILGLWHDIEFALTLPSGAHPIVGKARVVRIDAERRPAVHFTSISFTDRWRLVRFVLDNQRHKTTFDLNLPDRHNE